MDEVFRVTTTISLPELRKFQNFHRRKYQLGFYIYVLVLIFLIFFLSFWMGYVSPGVWFAVCAVLFFIFTRILIQYKQNKSPYMNIPQTVMIYNENLRQVTSRSDCTILLEDLLRVCETADCFYLYTNKNNALVLRKDGFEFGTPEQMSNFFYYKMPAKYKRCF